MRSGLVFFMPANMATHQQAYFVMTGRRLSRNFSSHERRLGFWSLALGFWSLAECRVAGRRLVYAVEVLCGHTRGFAPTERGISMRSWCCGLPSGRGYELHSVLLSLALQEGKFALFASTVKLPDALIYPTLSFHNQSIIKAGQNARHGFDGFVASQLGPKISTPCAEITVRTYQCLRGHSKRISYAIGAVFAYMTDHPSSAYISLGT